MSRDEYLQNTNEGFIKDTIKKGWDKIKSLFKIGMRKIKDFIAIFDNKGSVLPVLSPQAMMDNFSGSSAIQVFGTKSFNESVSEAGGNVNNDKPSFSDNGDTYDYGPSGEEFFDYILNDEYKEDREYQNLMSIPSIIQEHFNISDEEMNKLFEDWESVKNSRVDYVDKKDLKNIKAINVNQFESVINGLIEDWSINSGKSTISVDGEDIEIGQPTKNVLIFGAPGIGKSTVPELVVDKFNKEVAKFDPSKMISFININCANLSAGDFMMPTMPKENDVLSTLDEFSETFPHSNEYLQGLNDRERKEVAMTIQNSGQFKSNDAPKCWLPSYKPVGNNKINKMLDDYSNGGVYMDKDNNTYKTGGGGIILFDELLRCDPDVFRQLMNFLLDRRLNGWVLGSKWAVIACSNRPCDDQEVAKVWKSWNATPAAKDRWEDYYQLIPDPESWKKWAKSKGCDELLLEFIFDKDSMKGDEYPRWHTMVKNSSESDTQNHPVTPRRWEKAFSKIGKYKIRKSRDTGEKISDLSELSINEIQEVLEPVFDLDFVTEITSWLEDRMDKIDLEGIIKNPKSVYIPKKFINDPDKAVILVQNLTSEIKSKYKEHPEELPDEQLANIMIWLGINYKNDMFIVHNFVEDLVKNVFKDSSDYMIIKNIKTFQVLEAAYPPRDIEDDVRKYETRKDESLRWPEGSMEILKDLMREYFPWRISGDEIKYYDDLDLGDGENKEE